MLISGRATNILLVLILAVGIGIVAMLASRGAAGPLDPPGPPSATDSVKLPGTAITSLPYTISQPGRYYVTRNLTGTIGQNGITVSSDNVTIDLDGFTLTGTSQTGAGIWLGGIVNHFTVRDGTVTNWQTGVEAGFDHFGRIEAVTATLNSNDGIRGGTGTVIANCASDNNGGRGIVSFGGTVSACTASLNIGHGILASSGAIVEACSAQSNQGDGINADASTVRGCSVYANAINGIELGSNSLAENNQVQGNATALQPNTGGIVIPAGGLNTIRNNAAVGNSSVDIKSLGDATNIIVNNELRYYSLGVGVNGPIVSKAAMPAATNPASNYCAC